MKIQKRTSGFLSLLISISFLLSIIAFPITAYSANTSIVRYTVLVLDVSGSMIGAPIKQMKAAAKNFTNQVLSADGQNYVALVTYSDNAQKRVDFSNDQNIINSEIDSLYDLDMTNTYDGLDVADKIFQSDNNIPSNAIKNIVFLSDGLPNMGEYTNSGNYTRSDYYNYGYANSVYNLAQILKLNYNIYTLGFFHSLTSSELAFAKRFMTDIQNRGYYDVQNGNELDFEFGKVAEEITDDGKYPIIIVPGIMGSRLFSSASKFDNSTKVWDPDPSLSGVWGLGDKLKGTLYVRPPEDQRTASSREYGAQDTYKEVVDKLCEKFPDRKIYLFSYDWREGIENSSQKLSVFIDSLKVDKVDLVCHSMGGLVASSYYCNYGDSKLDKIITAGTPYEGAPKLLNAVQNWDVLGEDAWGFEDNVLGLIGGLRKSVKRGFISVAELAPTANYVSKQPMWRDSKKWFNRGDYTLDYDSYIKILKEIFPESSVNTAENFHNSLHNKNGYNALLGFPNAYFSIGCGQKTISSIKFQYSNVDIDQKMYEDDLGYDIKGDGTVPYLSSSIMEQIDKLPLERWCTFNTTHGGTIGHHENSKNKNYQTINSEADKSLNWIVDILEESTSDISHSKYNNQGYLVIRIACPVDVSIGMANEDLVYSSAKQIYIPSTSFGRMDVLGVNDEIKMFCIDDKSDYDISILGTDKGTMDFEFRVFDGNGNLVSEYAAYDVQINEKTSIKTGTDYSNPLVLSIDDGVNKSSIEVKKQSILKLVSEKGGTISHGEEGVYDKGDAISLVAAPDEGYVFKEWKTSAGGSFSNINDVSTTFLMPSNDTTVTAVFELKDSDDTTEPDNNLQNTTTPATTTNSTTINTNLSTPNTGDNSNLLIWIILMFISFGLIVGSLVCSVKKKKFRLK